MKRNPMAFDDCIGADGRVRLRCYLPLADTAWLSAGCRGPHGCRRTVAVGIAEAIRLVGGPEATVGEVERRLRCGACGGREMRLQVAVGPRPPEVRRHEGPLPEACAGLGGRSARG